MAGGPVGGHGPNRVIEFAVDKHLIPADGVPEPPPTIVEEEGEWIIVVQLP